MTRYAYHLANSTVLAIWSTGPGDLAAVAADLPATVTETDALDLVAALTALSRLAWRTYTHPSSGAASLEPNTEGWRRESEREAFGRVIDAVRKPNLPRGGALLQSYVQVEEAAHRVGRVLHHLADTGVINQIVADLRIELVAVEDAERGDLSGRARQAVALTRADASPLQIAAADALLRADPLGPPQLDTEVEPTAASVAAAHWLQAAADVAAEAASIEVTQVLIEADNIEAFAHQTPTLVLELLATGMTPRAIVLGLIGQAMAVAEGEIPDVDGLRAFLESTTEQPQDTDEPTVVHLSALDPARPAQDLLEDLLDGIRGCSLLYEEYAEDPEDPADDAGYDEAAADETHRLLDRCFRDAVRAEAAAHSDRLR